MRSPTSARELLHRPDGGAEHALALFDGQVRPRQQLDVRAVRGQRRPQLVRGVRDQLLLSLLRLVEGCEHRVEVGCEACQLVPAAAPGSAGSGHASRSPRAPPRPARAQGAAPRSRPAVRAAPPRAPRRASGRAAASGRGRSSRSPRSAGVRSAPARRARTGVASCTAASPRRGSERPGNTAATDPFATDASWPISGTNPSRLCASASGTAWDRPAR